MRDSPKVTVLTMASLPTAEFPANAYKHYENMLPFPEVTRPTLFIQNFVFGLFDARGRPNEQSSHQPPQH
jgi:hypothetical protein